MLAFNLRSSESRGNDILRSTKVADLATTIGSIDPLMARLNKRYLSMDKLADKAEQDTDIKGFVNIVRSETERLELEARLTGRLDTGGSTDIRISINFGTPPSNAPSSSPADIIEVDYFAEDTDSQQ